jgi:hypothetical protein
VRHLRFAVELALGSLTGGLTALTAIWHDWLEAFVHLDIDSHSGAVEWTLVGLLAVTSCLAGTAARAEWRKRIEGSIPTTGTQTDSIVTM